MAEPISESPSHHRPDGHESSRTRCTGKLPRGLKICCGITTIILIIVIVIGLVLFFTVLKPRKPRISTHSVTLDSINWVPFPVFHLNITLSIVVTVDNRNYGSFKYGNSTAFVTYRGIPAAQAPIQEDTIPARAKHNIGTTVVVVADKLPSNRHFSADLTFGILNFTSTTSLHGKATVFKILKIKVTTFTTCDMSVNVVALNTSSVCHSEVKY